MKYKSTLFCIAFLFFSLLLPAQIDTISAPEASLNYRFQAAGKDGLLVFYDLEKKDTRELRTYFELYDTSFVRVGLKSVLRSESLDQVIYFYSASTKTMYLLFFDSPKTERQKNQFKLVSFDIINNAVSTLDGAFPSGFNVTSFYVLNNAGYIHNFGERWVKINLDDATMKPMNMGVKDATTIYSSIENIGFHTTSLVFREKSKTGSWGFKTRNFGKGKDNKNTTIFSGNDSNLATLEMIQIDSNIKFGSGTYTKKGSREDEKRFPESEQLINPYFIPSTGYYITKTVRNIQSYIKFFALPMLDSILDNTAKRVEGDKVTPYKATIHTPIRVDSTYIVIMDIGKRLYRETLCNVDDYTYVGNKTRVLKYNELQFEKDIPKYSLVMAFDEMGNMLWKDSFTISNKSNWIRLVSSTNLQKSATDESYQFFYFTNGTMKCKRITSKGVTDIALATSTVMSGITKDGEEVVFQMIPWYGNTGLYSVKVGQKVELILEKYK